MGCEKILSDARRHRSVMVSSNGQCRRLRACPFSDRVVARMGSADRHCEFSSRETSPQCRRLPAVVSARSDLTATEMALKDGRDSTHTWPMDRRARSDRWFVEASHPSKSSSRV